MALANLIMAQHTDPGSIPVGARPLRIEDEQEELPGEPFMNMNMNSKTNININRFIDEEEEQEQDDEVSVQSALLLQRDGIDISSVMGKGIQLDNGNGNENGIGNGNGNEDKDEDEHCKEGESKERGGPVSSSGSGNFQARQKKKIQRKRGIRRCRKCANNYKPPRSHHDSVTGRCISKFDHFCPWIGNAVGAMNHKFFVLFIFYTFLTSLISLYLIVERFIRCGYTIPDVNGDTTEIGNINDLDSRGLAYYGNGDVDMDVNVDVDVNEIGFDRLMEDQDDMASRTFLYDGCVELYTLQTIVLLVMSVAFLVFTCVMLFDQVDAIESNQSKIARMKVRQGQDLGEYEKVADGYNEMFGVGIGSQGAHVGLHWFLPTPVRFPDDREKDRVMGYEFYDLWHGRVYQEDDEEFDEEVGCGSSAAANGHGSLPALVRNRALRNGVAEIELPAGNGKMLARTNRNGTVNRRSTSHQESDLSEHSSRIV